MIIWNDLASGGEVHELDALFVPPGVEARVTFIDGTTLELDERSLVVVDAAQAGRRNVSVRQGSVEGSAGAGGLLLASRADSVQLLDINHAALRFSAANAELNGFSPRIAHSDVLSGAEGPLDLIVANPPYLADEEKRTYRDGGGALGTGLSARITAEALDRLTPGGRLLLYTATPVIDGEHVLWQALAPLLGQAKVDYRELDPDVFGEELERQAYGRAERIAVVALDATKL